MKLKFVILTLTICVGLMAENELAGTTGFAFLKVNYSARATAMGNAYTGLSNGADAVFFNPAGLDQIINPELAISYMNYFDGIQTGAVSYTRKLNSTTHIATFIKYMNSSETRTLSDESGQYLGEDGTFGFSNMVLGVSGSRFINQYITIGANLKFLLDILDENSASAIAADIGLLHQTTNENLKLGVTFRNFGKQLTSYTESDYSENLPNIISVGFSYHPVEKIYATFDINKPLVGEYSAKAGAEYQVHNLLALRAGYKSNAKDWKAGGDWEAISGLSFGMGINWKTYVLDYAVASYGDLGFINNITVSYRF